MFWPFVGAVFLAAMMFQLGALSVWVVVFKVGLLCAGIALVLAAVAFLWRRLKRSHRPRLIENKT